jgi:molybdopterin molybdotransferase
MLSVREALDRVLGAVHPGGTERVGLFEAVGRALAEDVVSLRDVPNVANSAMDGYAVRREDVASVPARLFVSGTCAAGCLDIPSLAPGNAIRIMTGATVPAGADTVIRVEDTKQDGDHVVIEVAGPCGANVRLAGEDVRAGDTMLYRGRRLVPADLGLAASAGRSLLLVHRRPRVAILSTGDELVEADQPVKPGQVVNTNAYALAAAVVEAGGIAIPLPIARDTPEEIRAAFLDAARADAILSTGGVSVGDFDYVKAVMDEIGVERLFWKVAQKPGKPLTFGILAGRPYFGLPGNPVSSLVCFYLYARPALRRMLGLEAVHLPTIEATLGHELRKSGGLTEFVRCRLEQNGAGWIATSTGTQGSHVLSSMSLGSGLIVAPPEASTLAAGSTVRVIRLDAEAGSAERPF